MSELHDAPAPPPASVEGGQAAVARFTREHGLAKTPPYAALDLVSEVGEVAKEILTATDYGRTPRLDLTEAGRARLASEIGDVVYALLDLANAVEVDAAAELRAALARYERRIAERGRPASS